MEDDKYLEKLRTFEGLSRTAMNLSIATHGRMVTSWQKEYASYIFGKICVTAIAILKLLPKSSFYGAVNNIEFWDISSVCTLVRSLIDTYNIFYYLIIEKIDESESEFRFVLWKLHSESERLKMLRLVNSKRGELYGIQQNIEKLKKKIIKNKFYQNLSYNKQKKLKSGKYGIFLTNSQISERAGVNPNYYKAIYKYLSSYVHTYPFSISQIAEFRAGDPKSLRLLETVIEFATPYISLSIRDFVKIFPDQSGKLSHQVVDTIKNWEYIVGNKNWGQSYKL